MPTDNPDGKMTLSGEIDVTPAPKRTRATLRLVSFTAMVSVTMIFAVVVSILADRNFVGWAFTLLTVAAVDVCLWLYLYPRAKHNRLWTAIAASLALLFFVLPMTNVVGRTTSLSAEEKKAAASAALEQDTKSFTHVIEIVDPKCTASATDTSWGEAVHYESGSCTLQFDLLKTSVTVFGTASLARSEVTPNNILKITVKEDHYPRFYMNVADYPGGRLTIPGEVLNDSTKTRFYAKR